MIIPAIDLMKGKIVQLEQGQKKKIELDENPLEFAKKFSECKEVQVVDLDAAMGAGENEELVKELCRVVNARVGGGIRDIAKAKELVEAGAKKVIIGTRAEKGFLKELCGEIGREKVVAALDSIKGEVVVKGWKQGTGKSTLEMAKELEPYCGEFLYTCVEREGLMQGTNAEMVKALKRVTGNSVTVAGGIKSIEEVRKLEKIGVNVVLGMALYTGKIKLDGVDIERRTGN